MPAAARRPAAALRSIHRYVLSGPPADHYQRAYRRLFARVQSLERITERDVPAGTVTGSALQSATLCRVIAFSESWV
jgi:hypothetical protein